MFTVFMQFIFSKFGTLCHQILKRGVLIFASILLVLPLILALPVQAATIYDLPPTAGGEDTWLVDEANVLSRLTETQVKEKLQDLAKQTGDEVHLVIIQRLDFGETTQDFADALFEKWFPTAALQANKILIVVDTLTTNSGIRVGEASDELLTADIAASVANETLLVPIRDGSRYNQAMFDVSDRLTAVLSGLPDPGPPIVENTVNIERTYATAEETQESNATTIVIVLLVIATVVPMATYFAYVMR
jgi:uncharacterized protein